MEEKQKPIKMKLHTFIIIIALVVIVMMAIFMYIQKRNSEDKIQQLQTEAAQLQETINELQGKLNSIRTITIEDKEVNASSENKKSNKTETTNNQKNTETKTIDLSEYKGVWQIFEGLDIPEEELIINTIDNNKVNFDFLLYRLASFENVNATISENVASFETKDENGKKLKGTITFTNKTVILNISESDDLPSNTYTFTIKSDKSILN